MKREHSVEYGRDTTNEEEVTWGVDSKISVPPHTATSAQLVINEQHYSCSFSTNVKIRGKKIKKRKLNEISRK